MDWINSKFINKSEVARAIGVNPIVFLQKIKGIKYNKITETDFIALENVKQILVDELKK
jgi:hypothetical protein